MAISDVSDLGDTNQTGVVAMAQYKTDGSISKGIIIEKQVFKDANYDSQDIDQLPFSFGVSGPATLRGRDDAYKTTTKAEAE